ncbi:squalene/phytoene synthase family protein [Nocardioides sp. TF02-7]|uniref:phytoene/squalene synthase family protein n=1 Tax=Nocardioides sp. TF02-7 TaxID=2917724 RepID=UPI001F064D9C|nr:squalene/phytoene synthase family protein [Nocardioides sp. TF02-7]UMG93395.1 squalene/phytoene synthase family protein [Nocardioides sp. TF02-7]
MTLFVRSTPPRNLYDCVSEGSAAIVIQKYSSSFGLASRLLGEPVRTHVRNIYALVRVADEVADNPDPAFGAEPRATLLSWLHEDVRHALRTGYSANLVVHAFARTAAEVGVDDRLVAPFFASMRMDLDTTSHTPESFARYVYGSAEVVGLMCLRAFLAAPDGPADRAAAYEALAPGARRLGAAFQKVNFLRDLADDHDVLRRDYFPGLVADRFCDADRDRILDDVDEDLAAADAVIPDLPPSSRRAVRAAHATFAELTCRLRRTSAAEIRRTRVRVPTPVKLRLAAGAIYGGRS